ncbi:MAG: outer membrane protein assembly factor BamB family protein [Armatimonadota bacterium]
MDRWSGKRFWYGLPAGGEAIGTIAPAFSNDGSTIYVVNDATESSSYPNGHPLMAFPTFLGPSVFRHNGLDPSAQKLSMGSPTIAPDGRIFMHAWADRPYAGTDNGAAIMTIWFAEVPSYPGLAEPALYDDGNVFRVVIGGRNGWVYCYDGYTGEHIWSVYAATMDATPTIDPSNGNIYIPAGTDNVYVVGLTKDGVPLWANPAMLVHAYIPGITNPQRAQSGGCLSHDGQTFYFQTNSQQGDGRLYAVNTVDGSVKWSYPTGSKGWEITSSCPIVTRNGVIIVGNNNGSVYYAIKDAGSAPVVVDTFVVASNGNAMASASISSDGLLYLPLRTTWTTSNGDGDLPTFQTENLFCCIDLRSGASVTLSPPPWQIGIALNRAVKIIWRSVTDPTGAFHHYAICRSTSPFSTVQGKAPIATVNSFTTTEFLDNGVQNGVRYYYAVTTVTQAGNEVKDVSSIGPYTPHDETDLQVVCISRTPRYPRYAAQYMYYSITEPSGFGPYWFSASTSLGMGQTGATKRWPDVGEAVTYTATVRNRGTNTWAGTLTGVWSVDGGNPVYQFKTITLQPGQTTTYSFVRNWDALLHDIRFEIQVGDARATNNSLTINTKSVAFLTYVDVTKIEQFRENTSLLYPQARTDDLLDWLNRHMVRFNELFAAAGCQKRVHYDVLEVLNDYDPDPNVETINFAIFPFRYRRGEGDPRLSGYYNPSDDIDYGLLHEMGHQLGMIDIYQFDVPASSNQVSSLGYSAVPCLMHGCSPVISEFHALAMNHWLDKAHGYYGQFMYNLPSQIRMRFLSATGEPLRGAMVKMYQYCERPGMGKVITTQIKAHGVTDSDGIFVLPNVPINQGLVPPAYTGDTLLPNPFGYVAVVGTNGVLHFRVEYQNSVDYCWLDITEAVVRYFRGETEVATFDRTLNLGGPIQHYPLDDLAELNAADWYAWADGSEPEHTYVVDDTTRKLRGAGSVKFVTNGGFDTCVGYSRTLNVQWDLRAATALQISFYAVNNNSFQNGSPWIRLKDSNGNYFQYQYYLNGYPYDLLNNAWNRWQSHTIPLWTSAPGDGWRQTIFGNPDPAHVTSLEIHADTWDYGFTLWVDGVRFLFPSAPVVGLPAVKASPDGSRADISEVCVSAVWTDHFYVQTLDRTAGIRVNMPGHALSVGDVCRVIGILATSNTGERFIDASWVEQTGRYDGN